MTLWSNTNFYNFLPWTFANMLRVPSNRLKVIPCTVGGSFGSKHLINKVIAIAGVLTKATGRPVKFMEDRVDNLAANDNVGPDRLYDAELAVTGDGEFLSLTLEIVDDYGAYFQFAHGQHGNALSQPTGPYRIGSLRYGISCVLTNKVQQGFFRGAGADPGNLILERLVDATADELGIERAEIRRRNFIQPEQFPYKVPTGNTYDSGNYEGVLDRALALADVDHWRAEQEKARAEGRYIGIGLASCQERSGYNATEWWFLYDAPPLPATSTPESVKLDVSAFGQVRVELGCPLWGNSPETVVSQVVAEEFGIDPSDVAVTYSDSSSGAISAGPGGSRLTIMLSGRRARRVADDQGQDGPHRRALDGGRPGRRRARRRRAAAEGLAEQGDEHGRRRDARPSVQGDEPRGRGLRAGHDVHLRPSLRLARRARTARTWAPSIRSSPTPATSRSSRSTPRRAS